MIVTKWTKLTLAFRKERRDLEAQGYRQHETDWEIHRQLGCRDVIVDAKVSCDGMYVYTKLGKRSEMAEPDRLLRQMGEIHRQDVLARLRGEP